jgi:catechol 2,3-dioxygenase-like lactoylglutathione lyase family enzyme
LTYELRTVRLTAVRATGINHVSIAAIDLEESTRFYEEVFGMERIPTPTFEHPVRWLRVGDLQLHLFLQQGSEPAPTRHHLGLTVDDFDAAYDAVKSRTSEMWSLGLVELPSGQVQLYFRDPAGNLIELNWPDVTTLDRSRYPELRRLADHIPQGPESDEAVLYLAAVAG